jgi:hypothetical protein
MPTPQELIQTARDAIGRGNVDTDWKILPTEHAQLFAAKAPSLARNLSGSRPTGLATMYEELNGTAVATGEAFKSTVSKANLAVFLTATFAALLLIAAGLQQELGKTRSWAVGGIGLMGVVSSGLAAMWLSQVKGGNLANKWSHARAKAEAKRLAYFKAIMQGASADPLDQLLALEYTGRFLLGNQIDYFRDRGRQHEAAAEAALKNSTNAVFVASTFTAIAGLLSIVAPQFAVIAGLGVIASAYATLVASRSAVNLDRTNADRYRSGEELLRERELDFDTYREKAARGDPQAVQEYFEPVFVALEADHKGFLNDAEKRELAIGEMEKRLDAAREALSKKPSNNDENR